MSAELSYVQLKTANDARVSEEVRVEQRKRNLLVLIRHYLEDAGFLDTVQMLTKEAGPALGQWTLCDNIDLATVLQEYEAYCYVKFKKFPKIAKRRAGSGNSKSRPPLNNQQSSFSLPSIPGCVANTSANTESMKSSKVKQRSSSGGHRRKPHTSSSSTSASISSSVNPVESGGDLGLTGSSIGEAGGKRHPPSSITKGTGIGARVHDDSAAETVGNETPEVRILKPLAGFAGYNSEMRELAAVISRDIYSHNPDVRWSDIIGLDTAKRLVKEAVVYPIKYPQLFTGILSPWKGLLLYGPPGTGKTMLAKAVATECKTTFFNISASTIVSKWRGDSEKLVRVLFELARFHAPSTIFMDELESIMGQRSGFGAPGGEHEGSRRMKTELLVQMDGLAKSSDLVFVLAASNLPWELDHAMLRRLEKRILVDLPNEEARCAMFKHHLPPLVTPPPFSVTSQVDYATVAKLTEGYSGSDIQLVCKEAAMKSVRQVFDRLESFSTKLPSDSEASFTKDIEIQPVRTKEVKDAIASTKPSATVLANRYLEWQRDYESV